MPKNSTPGKILRVTAIVLMGLTAVFTLLGGIGSSCVALGAEKYESMLPLAPFKWLYQILVVLTLAAAVFGIRATTGLIKRKVQAYREALIALAASALLAGIQMITSQVLRGKSQPNDMRFYISTFTLIYFLLLRLPGVWRRVGFSQSGTSDIPGTASGLTMFLVGVTILSVHIWAAPTHTFGGTNFADVWHTQLAFAGWALALLGVMTLAWKALAVPSQHGNRMASASDSR